MFPRSLVLDALSPIEVTGERTGPGIPEENYWFQRHAAAYHHLARGVRGKVVLDAGSGEGFGAAMLAAGGAHVLGVDVDAGITRRAVRRYRGARFETADVMSLPCSDASFDLVVSVQVLEHLADGTQAVREMARVVRPGGQCAVVTPNRLTFSPQGVHHGFHTREFSSEELVALCAPFFTRCTVKGLFHGPRLAAHEEREGSSLVERMMRTPPGQWSHALREEVEAVRAEDFEIRADGVERSLDLVIFNER